MLVLRVDPTDPAPETITRAARVLLDGGLVAFPTETVYGLGANALDATAVRKIFAAKGRPAGNPLIVHVPDAAAAGALVSAWPPAAEALAEAFWPGPLTLVLPRTDAVPDEVTGGGPTVGVRVPAHPVALALLREVRVPLAAPSANRSNLLSPTSAEHVVRGLGERVDLVLDAGPTPIGIESAVVDLAVTPPRILRPGSLSAERIAAVLARVGAGASSSELARASHESESGPAPAPARSPGMLPRHYAPRAELRLFGAGEEELAAEWAKSARSAGQRVCGLLLRARGVPVDDAELMPTDPAAYARAMYSVLHRMDDEGCGLILVERVPAGEEWAGVRDRLDRAAAQDA